MRAMHRGRAGGCTTGGLRGEGRAPWEGWGGAPWEGWGGHAPREGRGGLGGVQHGRAHGWGACTMGGLWIGGRDSQPVLLKAFQDECLLFLVRKP